MFSMRAISVISESEALRTYAGTVRSPAREAARQRRDSLSAQLEEVQRLILMKAKPVKGKTEKP